MSRACSGFYLPLKILELLLFVININNVETVDGQWSAWIGIFPCSVTCGNGTQTRYRFCNNHAPLNGGTNCQGDDRQTISCSKDCPVDGQWSSWINWFSCSVTCGSGINKKFRFCNNPSPSNGGRYCQGNEQETEICSLRSCPAFYEWSPWTNWFGCSVSCGSGTRTRHRSCNGTFYTDCNGEFRETEACSTRSCPDLKYSTDFPYPSIDPASSSGTNYTVLSIVIGVLVILIVVAGIAFGVYKMRGCYTCGCLKAPEASIHVTTMTGSLNVPTHVTEVTGTSDRPTHVTAVTGSSDDTSLNYPPPPYSYIERMYGAAKYPSPPPSYSSLDYGYPPPSYSSLQSLF